MALTEWIPTAAGVAIRGWAWRFLVKGHGAFAAETGVSFRRTQFMEIGEKVFLDRNVLLHGGHKFLRIGDRTRVMYGANVNVYNFRDLECSHISIGSDCVIGPYSVLWGQGGLDIGDNVIMAPRVSILPVNHKYIDPVTPIKEQGLDLKGIKIASNVWIGSGAIILDGVDIGEGAVVGAGSVVTKSIAPRSVAAGNPAEVVKTLGTDKT